MKKAVFLLIILFVFLSSANISAAESEDSKFIITGVSPETLHPADSSTVSITIKNIGTHSGYHVATEILVDDKSPIRVRGEAKKSIGTSSQNSLGRDGVVTVQYEFYTDRDAKATVYPVEMRVIWSDEPDAPTFKDETLDFGIRVSGQARGAEIDIRDVTTVPAEITPGTEASLEIELQNIGYSTINLLNVRLIADYPFTPLDSDWEEYITGLEPGEATTVNFNLAVDSEAPSSYYEIPIILEYEDEFGACTKNSSIGIPVKGDPKVLIQEIILEPGKLITGTEGLFMIRVINTGTESAEDVKIRISGAGDIFTEEHQFIGEIAPGDSQTATFGVSVDEEAETGKHGLKISITYEDESGTSYSNSKIYELSIFGAESFLPTEYVIALVVIAVLAVIAYLVITVRFKK